MSFSKPLPFIKIPIHYTYGSRTRFYISKAKTYIFSPVEAASVMSIYCSFDALYFGRPGRSSLNLQHNKMAGDLEYLKVKLQEFMKCS